MVCVHTFHLPLPAGSALAPASVDYESDICPATAYAHHCLPLGQVPPKRSLTAMFVLASGASERASHCGGASDLAGGWGLGVSEWATHLGNGHQRHKAPQSCLNESINITRFGVVMECDALPRGYRVRLRISHIFNNSHNN